MRMKTIHLYMYAAQTSEEKFTSAEAKAISDKLIAACTLEVTAKYKDGRTEVVYVGPVYGKGVDFDMTEENAIYLGKFKKDDEATLETKLHVPEEWNKGGAVGMIDWIFTCQEEETPEVIPPAPKPEPIVKTGDSNSNMQVIILSIVSIICIGIIGVVLIKKKRD